MDENLARYNPNQERMFRELHQPEYCRTTVIGLRLPVRSTNESLHHSLLPKTKDSAIIQERIQSGKAKKTEAGACDVDARKLRSDTIPRKGKEEL
ncbi:unnamed protein product [Protopolystoma xenopodis]|uniref:Uncharacterized protein n=1 Tax=Protopolystoma xenopodis TaxID=117903 RepID=A0A3S5BT93_9PLAT|nr:unnamed protein product [Protopolystoma xenopodis]